MSEEKLQCGNRNENEVIDAIFWEKRWQNNEIGWDFGYASPPIVNYIREYKNKNAKILIPGCGNAYEAEFLVKEGFTDITILDFSPKAVEILQKKFKDNSEIKIFCQDFFSHESKYDLIIEQTFFCALHPLKRKDYVQKSSEILNKKGEIIGVLFDINFNKEGPPFGGSSEEYSTIFEKHFELKTLEKCYNSIPERLGKEVFIKFIKK